MMSRLNNYSDSIGVVVIGRNEGARLKKCLESIIKSSKNVVYVDSGSTDNSIDIAKSIGTNVAHLDLSKPFTAARARNEGFKRLREMKPDLSFVQFVDGDCEIAEGWFGQAAEYLSQSQDIAVVCGRRRERYPDASIYNMLCDIEWNTPVGEAKACGGDALIRSSVFEQVEGFNPDLIAGEEPELCVRIRQLGWKVWRLDAEMTMHDANITRFGQWWKRNVRSGYAFALGSYMHGASSERHWESEVKRAQLWGGYIPLAITLATIINIAFLIGFLIYPLQVVRIALTKRQTVNTNWIYALFVTLGKFPEMQGQIKFYLNRLFKSHTKIIEYKK